MKETTTLSAVLTSLLFGEQVTDFFANHPFFLISLIAAVLLFWYRLFRKPPQSEGI